MDWYKLVKRYVWDEEKTPYLIRVARLHKGQAASELFVYVVFLMVVFGLMMVLLTTEQLPQGRSVESAFFAFTLVISAILLGVTRHRWFAYYCALAPVGILLFFLIFGFPPSHGLLDHVLVIVLMLLWLRYAWRIVQISQFYEEMPPAPPYEPRWKRRWKK